MFVGCRLVGWLVTVVTVVAVAVDVGVVGDGVECGLRVLFIAVCLLIVFAVVLVWLRCLVNLLVGLICC